MDSKVRQQDYRTLDGLGELSLKQACFRSVDPTDHAESLTDNTVSDNGCPDNRTDSDSESVSAGHRRATSCVPTLEYSAADVQRFWAKVRRSEGCWEWTASRLGNAGHGQFTVRRPGKQHHLYAHRVSWELANGPIPAGLCVLHRCDNPPCVRPDHLFLGTQPDNLTDARKKGRLIDGAHSRRLSDDAYREILAKPYRRGSGVALARKHGVTEHTVSNIRCGHAGVVFHRAHPVLERVAFVNLPVRGDLVLQAINPLAQAGDHRNQFGEHFGAAERV